MSDDQRFELEAKRIHDEEHESVVEDCQFCSDDMDASYRSVVGWTK